MRELTNSEISPLVDAIRLQDVNEVGRLLSAYGHVDALMAYGRTSLHDAAENNCEKVANFLITNGADLEKHWMGPGLTPLQIAIEFGSLETVEVILNGGARVNALSMGGRTSLHYAVRRVCDGRGREILDLLLRYKPNVNVADKDGVTPLDMAIDYGEEADLLTLLALGADPNARIDSETRLHRLATGGLPARYAELLIEWGADIHARDDEGRRPIDIALKQGRRDRLIEVLSGTS